MRGINTMARPARPVAPGKDTAGIVRGDGEIRIVAFDSTRYADFLRRCALELLAAENGEEVGATADTRAVDARIDRILQCVRAEGGCVAVAEFFGEPAGLAAFSLLTSTADRSAPATTRAVLHDLVVLPAFRRRGVGTALLRHAEARARGAGARGLRLRVRAGDYAAHTFLARCGYRPRILQLEKPIGHLD